MFAPESVKSPSHFMAGTFCRSRKTIHCSVLILRKDKMRGLNNRNGSLTNLDTLNFIEIHKNGANQYCVLINGIDRDGTLTTGVYAWDTLKDAMTCAKGIAKMFNFPEVLINKKMD
ncbi:hypothetical protein OB236_00010 [Paenibacillus sp. WQ 127069]|uniref:Uncharacterized protein n=1 Tax=Paenibacillus baimaensis TaxID=2982185 RepID=A0ABT2U925_9BACL|nr:hypothetical protein [Paenibacillus sp. WQ 127069]